VRILHISAADNAGGSGRSAYRIHQGLRSRGHVSRMLVNYRVTNDPDVGYIWRALGWRAADWLARSLTERMSLQYVFYPSSFALAAHPWFRQADVVQLYNTHGGFFSYSALAILSRRKPIVWRLSDMWPLTGHCAYAFDCDRWKTGCGACPRLHDAPGLRTDRTALLWKWKRTIYSRSKITIVAPSTWIAGLAAESPLLSRFPIHQIPNGLDTAVFRAIDRAAARELFGLDPTAKVLLFLSLEIDAIRKGGAVLEAAVAQLSMSGGAPFHVMAVGNGAEGWATRLSVPVTAIPAIHDDRLLAAAYSAADVFVLPTLAENLPNSALESMACGTPVVAFATGGVVDAVRPGQTGWLARSGDSGDLAHRIAEALANDQGRTRMGHECRAVVEREYSLELQASRFEALYVAVGKERGRAA
jgi:glycosyltransferase involved in cell wall biosynthesis